MKNEALQKTLINGLMHGLYAKYESIENNGVKETARYWEEGIVNYGVVENALHEHNPCNTLPYLRDLLDFIDWHKVSREMQISKFHAELIVAFCIGAALDIPSKLMNLLIKHHFNVFDLKPNEYIKVTEENNPYK